MPPPKTRFIDLLKPLVNKNDTYWQRTLHMVLLLAALILVGTVSWSRTANFVIGHMETMLSIRSAVSATSPRHAGETVPVEKSR